MPLPDFTTSDGYPTAVLPPGVHGCSEEEFSNRFVDAFAGSERRPLIRDGFLRLRRTVEETLGLPAVQWADGSFVEAKPEPGDVDVVTFVDADRLNGLDGAAQKSVVELLDGGEATKPRYSTHTFLVPHAPTGHPYREVSEEARRYWRRWFGRTRKFHPGGEGTPRRAEKGLVSLELDGDGSPPKVSAAPSGGEAS